MKFKLLFVKLFIHFRWKIQNFEVFCGTFYQEPSSPLARVVSVPHSALIFVFSFASSIQERYQMEIMQSVALLLLLNEPVIL